MSLLPLLSVSLLLLAIQTHSDSTSRCQYSFKCGDLTISYPFSPYDQSTPEHCGVPGFLISCEDNVPILHLQSENYTVRSIDYGNNTIALVDTDVLNAACPRVQKNVSFYMNSGVNYTSSDVILTFFFDCNPLNTTDSNSVISCLGFEYGSSYVFYNEYLESQPIVYANLKENCRSIVAAPVLEYYLYPYNTANLNTTFGQALQKGFQLGWNSTDNCTKCQNDKGQCGYTLSNDGQTHAFKCFCANGTCDRKKRTHLGFILGISLVAFSSISVLCILAFLVYRRKYGDKTPQNVKAALEKFGSLAPKRYSFLEIRKITKSYNQKIGQGGFANVFKGELRDGSPVAVKVFKDRESTGIEFTSEVVSIASTSHVNIVRLLGFAIKGSKRALIYEYMPNGSLDKYVSQNTTLNHGACTRLFEIAVGIARGLEYLHRGCNTRIIHFDIKPHNILLDQDYCPKISDFGLAKFCQPKESIISMSGMRGTPGYIAPEVCSRNFGVVSSKSDVYSYGMILLEMFGGKQNKKEAADSETYFPDNIYKCVEQNNICSAYGVSDASEGIIQKVMIVGIRCIQVMPHLRPTIHAVLEMLATNNEELTLPPLSNVSLELTFPPPLIVSSKSESDPTLLPSWNISQESEPEPEQT